jgi:hypothetical protein
MTTDQLAELRAELDDGIVTGDYEPTFDDERLEFGYQITDAGRQRRETATLLYCDRCEAPVLSAGLFHTEEQLRVRFTAQRPGSCGGCGTIFDEYVATVALELDWLRRDARDLGASEQQARELVESLWSD